MILKAHLEQRQGVTLYLVENTESSTDMLKVGYFACSGLDALALLCTLQLLCRPNNVKTSLFIEGEKELLEWIKPSE